MPSRQFLRPRFCIRNSLTRTSSHTRCYAAAAAAISNAPPIHQTTTSVPPIARYPAKQPPSHKPPELRKTQLHRQYTSLLRSSPLILLFQHNNLKSEEWMGIRRELNFALRKLDEEQVAKETERIERLKAAEAEQDSGNKKKRKDNETKVSAAPLLADSIKLQVLQTGIFESALKIVEFYDPVAAQQSQNAQSRYDKVQPHPTNPKTPTSTRVANVAQDPNDPMYDHSLSRAAYNIAREGEKAAKKARESGEGPASAFFDMEPLLSGPLAALPFPVVSPAHLAVCLSLLAPSPAFPAPKRKVNPGYHDPSVQGGVQKLMLLGARVEGKVFDQDGIKWVGGIEGGLDGLRASLVNMLQNIGGANITNVLEGAVRSLYFSLEGRKGMLEEEEKGGAEETPAAAAEETQKPTES
ncbi:hypothetical protein K402DRAFT_456947 [Aulographum hederae CBS 113979]|uniref:Ribosomal protein YmL11, mitochondrial n=1 Tax=Aulographum hederae CBS 113979 TaxID=1176131 RepID=A0A6G1GQ13_9PEZI|nr:hypothetical protein K402DRAFT_456947 [Aulographum hederae CBS 113979]